MMTTIHPAVLEQIQTTVKRRKLDGSEDVPCPHICQITSPMRGVDRGDPKDRIL